MLTDFRSKITVSILFYRYNPLTIIFIIPFALLLSFNIFILHLSQTKAFLYSIPVGVILTFFTLIVFDYILEFILNRKLNDNQNRWFVKYATVLALPLVIPYFSGFIKPYISEWSLFFSSFLIFIFFIKLTNSIRFTILIHLFSIIIGGIITSLSIFDMVLVMFLSTFFIMLGLRMTELSLYIKCDDKEFVAIKKTIDNLMEKKREFKHTLPLRYDYCVYIDNQFIFMKDNSLFNELCKQIHDEKIYENVSNLIARKSKIETIFLDSILSKDTLLGTVLKKTKVFSEDIAHIYRNRIKKALVSYPKESNITLFISLFFQSIVSFVMFDLKKARMTSSYVYENYELLDTPTKSELDKELFLSDLKLNICYERLEEDMFKINFLIRSYIQIPSDIILDSLIIHVNKAIENSVKWGYKQIIESRIQLASKLYGENSRRVTSFYWPKKFFYKHIEYLEKLDEVLMLGSVTNFAETSK